MWTRSSASFALCASLVLCATAAQAFDRHISFCNRTTSPVDIAIGLDFAGTSEITSKGWFKVRGCTCRSLLRADLRATEIFFLASRSGFDNVLQGGRAPLCVSEKGFSFRAQNTSRQSCSNAGGHWATFKMYDTGNRTNYRLNLRSPGQCNLMDDT